VPLCRHLSFDQIAEFAQQAISVICRRMSPLSLRRYRAERLLRQEFEGLRGRVLATVRGRLRASGVSLDQGDLEACYAQAWQGLYTAVLEGQEIASPAGWLALVTFRRAIDEHRARGRTDRGRELQAGGAGGLHPDVEPQLESEHGAQRDFAAELDDRMRLRQLFEGLRGRLDGREREAAALCYLQGLSRSEAAARLGVSEARMRKLMEGRGPGRPGVAGKVGALVQTIREDGWCEEQGSLMRAFAFGILDPAGERYRLALMHSSQCSACRAYVASLRGLAAALPPVFLPWGLGAGVFARAGRGLHAGGTSAGAQAGRGLASGLPASGAAGAGGAAGGGWLIGAGPLSAKLAAGCLLALGVGAGCIALDGGHRVPAPLAPRHPASRSRAAATARPPAGYQASELAGGGLASNRAGGDTSPPLTPAARASREFGPEQALASGAAASGAAASGAAASGAAASGASRGARAPAARSASSGPRSPLAADVSAADASAAGGSSSGDREVSAGAGDQSAPRPSPGDSPAAEREFSPG